MSSGDSMYFMLIGKTGHGKSSTANSILLRDGAFGTSDGSTSMTKHVQIETTEIGNTTVKVVDTPGLIDTHDMVEGQAMAKMVDHMTSSIAMCPHGVDAFIFVLNYAAPRFTQEDVDTLRTLEKIFSSSMMKEFGIVIFTHKDNFDNKRVDKNEHRKSFQEWCFDQEEPNLKYLLETVNYRCLGFDNNQPTDRQRSHLLEVIDVMNPMKERYTHELFKKAAAGRRLILAEENLPKIERLMDDIIQEVDYQFQDGWRRSVADTSHDSILLLILLDIIEDKLKQTSSDLNSLNYPEDILHKCHKQVEDFLTKVNSVHEETKKYAESNDESSRKSNAAIAAAIGGLFPFLSSAIPGKALEKTTETIFKASVGIIKETAEEVMEKVVKEASEEVIEKTTGSIAKTAGGKIGERVVQKASLHISQKVTEKIVKKATESYFETAVKSLVTATAKAELYKRCPQSSDVGYFMWAYNKVSCAATDPVNIASLAVSVGTAFIFPPAAPFTGSLTEGSLSYLFDNSVEENMQERELVRTLARDARNNDTARRVNLFEDYKIKDD